VSANGVRHAQQSDFGCRKPFDASFANCRYFLITQPVRCASSRIRIDSKWTANLHRRPQRKQHALALCNCCFLPQQPFRQSVYPKYARHSGYDLLRCEIAAQHPADSLEHLPHQERCLPRINAFNSCDV
jgi:hypothetical protein